MSPLAIRHQASIDVSCGRDEELTELEISYNSPATELGDVLVSVADALDETMHAQAFEVSGDLGPADA